MYVTYNHATLEIPNLQVLKLKKNLKPFLLQ